MSLATIIYSDGHRQLLGDADREAAIEAYEGLRAQAPEVTSTVRAVILPPSWRPGFNPDTQATSQPEPLRMAVRGLDDIDTDPDRKQLPIQPSGRDLAAGADNDDW